MDVNSSKSTTSLDERTRKNYKLMAPYLKRTCLSAESALAGRPNVEDVPLGAKLPMIPGNRLLLYTTNLCQKLHLPSCDFDRTYPSDVYVSNEYRCLHDPHLKNFFVDKPEMRKRLCKNKHITPENKVICSLKEYNLYRQYLKHLSIEYLNKKYLEQYEAEYKRIKQETWEQILKRQKDVNNPITKRIERARKCRNGMEKELEAKKRKLMRKDREEKERRTRERKEDQLRRIINEENREREREQIKQSKGIKEWEDNVMRELLLNLKYGEDNYRRRLFEEKMRAERKHRERIMIENYERKKKFQHMKMLELKRLLADEETRRKARVASWEQYFTRKQSQQQDALNTIKKKDEEARDKRNKKTDARLNARGWTGNACRRKSTWSRKDVDKKTQFSVGDGRKLEKTHLVRQLSAMGFHNVMISPDVLKVMWGIDGDSNGVDTNKGSSGDAVPVLRHTLSQQARKFCDDIIRHGFASEYVRHVVDTTQALETTSRDLVSHVIDVSRGVLFPMLQNYEKRTGVKVAPDQIPDTLHDLCEGVFDEEEDDLPELVSFQEGGKATLRTGKKDSNVRFVVSNTDLPFDYNNLHKRPPTPKRTRFASSSDDDDDSLSDVDLGADSQMVLEETIKNLSLRVVDQVFTNCNLKKPDLNKDEMQEQITQLANSIVDEIILFGAENAARKTPSSVSSEESMSSAASLEQKISHLARSLISEVVGDAKKPKKDEESYRSSSAASSSSSGSDLSILALRVVRSILGTVDPTTGKTIREHASTRQDLEEKVAKLSAKVVDEVIRERKKQLGADVEELEAGGYAELEEKISRLALNIVTSAIEGKRPDSSESATSMCSAEMEERVSDLSARIIGAILSLKKILPTMTKQETKQMGSDPQSVDAVDRLLREIFNLDALCSAPEGTLRNVTNTDIQRISDDIARRLIPPRDDSSAVSSGMSSLAAALATNALGKAQHSSADSTVGSSVDDAVDLLADIVVDETLGDGRIISDESKISSAISEIAGVMIEEALAGGAASDRLFSSSESKLSSAISDIAQAITQETLKQKLSSQSEFSSGVSRIAEAVTAETINKAQDNTMDSSELSALESGISDLATNTVDESVTKAKIIDSSTKSAISSGIKTLAEKIAQQAIDIAAADPEGLGSSTRSAISSGASDLAAHIASLISGPGSVSTSTLESVLSSAVSDMVTDILTQRVLHQVREHDSSISSSDLEAEVGRLVQNMLGLKPSESKQSRTSVDTKSSKDVSTSSAVESGISDLAFEVVRELLVDKPSSTEQSSDNSSAMSLVAARYVNQILGVSVEDNERNKNLSQEEVVKEEDIVPVHVLELESTPERRNSDQNLDSAAGHIADAIIHRQSSSSNGGLQNVPRPPKTDNPNRKGRKKVRLKVKSTGNLQGKMKEKRGQKTFASSFTDWRQSSENRGKSLNDFMRSGPSIEHRDPSSTRFQIMGDFQPATTSSQELNTIMESLASRIVSSVINQRENEESSNPSHIGQDLNQSQSVEQLVGSLALGVVTSLLGLDVLNSATSISETVEHESGPADQNSTENENPESTDATDGVTPGPSARVDVTIETSINDDVQTPLKEHKVSEANCQRILNILCSEGGARTRNAQTTEIMSCDDNALEHPHRVPSPSRKRRVFRTSMASKFNPKDSHKSFFPKMNNWFGSKNRKSSEKPTEGNPLKSSAGFLNRKSLVSEDRPNTDKVISSRIRDLRHDSNTFVIDDRHLPFLTPSHH